MADHRREQRKLVKARLLPAIYDQVDDYAQRHRRSLSAAVEDLVVLGLNTEQRPRPDAGEVHYR